MRGSRVALVGAPRKEPGLTRQIVVGEDDEVVYYKLPNGKKRTRGKKHDLMDTVDNIRGRQKKH